MRWSRAYEWYTSGPRQRLQPGGAIRLGYDKMESQKDLTGYTVRRSNEKLKQITGTVIEFPAILGSR
jgi:hypothetical protein